MNTDTIIEYNNTYCYSDLLPYHFLKNYTDVQPKWGYNGLGYIVYKRTYARKITDDLTEEWWQTVSRCVNGAQKIGAQYTEEEAQRLFDLIFNLKCNFGGRMLWQLGTSTVDRFGLASLLNCWWTSMREVEDFCFLFEHLMLGGGVGFSVKREDIHELPRVKKGVEIQHLNTKDADFIVPDSRQGWVELLRKTLESFFTTGKSFTYSTILVRGAGEPIAGFGGTASGPQILIDGLSKIITVLKTRCGKKLRSIDVLDINNIIGSVVVAGNVRRSAQVAIGDPDDYLFLRAKNWSDGNVPNWRSMSNNSIGADNYNHISSEIWSNGYILDKKTGNAKGEAYGFLNLPLSKKYGRLGEERPDNCEGGNPCQPKWAKVLTKKGIRTFSDINVGDEIWSKEGWTKVTKKWSTGIKKVYEYRTTSGIFYGTENHRIISNGVEVEVGEADSIDSLTGEYSSDGVVIDPKIVMDGLVIGDGSFHKASNDLVYLLVGEDDTDYHSSEISHLLKVHRPGLCDTAWEIETSVVSSELEKTFNRVVPERFYYGDKSTVASFLRGLYTANGSICAKRVTFKTSSEKLRDQVQTMLSSLGIKSYYTTNKPSKVTFSNGEYTCKESYDINITTDRNKFYNLIGFIQNYKTEKLEETLTTTSSGKSKTTFDIKDVNFISEEEVFDITVDNKTHTYWTQGCDVHNCMEIILADGEACNLCELYLNNIESEEELFDCARLLYKVQKSIWTLPALYEKTDKIVKKNMRIGLGVTGICQAFDKVDWLYECYNKLRDYDKEWSQYRGWPESIKLTTVKPSGCVVPSTVVKTEFGNMSMIDIFSEYGEINLPEKSGEYREWYPVKHPLKVLDLNGEEQSVSKLFVNGIEETIKITFDDDMIFECTPDHKLLLVDGTWKVAKDLTSDDELQQLNPPISV